MDRADTAKILSILTVVWPKVEISNVRLTAYSLAWSDVDYRFMEQAAADWIRDEKYFPAPASLRDIALTYQDRHDRKVEAEFNRRRLQTTKTYAQLAAESESQ
jgi:hypothetical protein